MAERVVLPDEAPDMTVTELHDYVTGRLKDVLRFLFGHRALVLGDIFVRVDETDQVSPDVLIVPGAKPGARTVYRIPPEPVPDITMEVLSPANDRGDGRRQLHHKRELLAAIGVRLHIELDPDRGQLTTWPNIDGRFVADPPTDRYDGDALAGLRIELAPGDVRLWLPDGREFIDAATEITRANDEAQRANDEAQRANDAAERADALTQRADQLAKALRDAGIDPDSV
jgi:Uma2 family endonuclease